jgi:NOL1/NOP2/fmu family ribosome biogenesis protein
MAIPKSYATEIQLLRETLKVLSAGVELGVVKGKNCVPSHSLALSTALNGDAFVQCEVDYAAAVAYLRGEAVVLADAPRGYVMLTHNGAALGFVNNLGNRANNLYPKEWRIRSTHVPAEKPKVIG